MRIRNRRGRNWQLEAAPWTAPGAARRVIETLHWWGYRFSEDDVTAVVRKVVETVLLDGGSRISVHVTDHNHQAVVLVLSHQSDLAPLADEALREIAVLGPRELGTETADDGRRLWVLLDLRLAA